MERRSVKNSTEQVPAINQAQEPQLTSEKDIAMDFVLRVHRKFDRLIKSSILFGSQAKNTATANSDIDIILIVDDAAINWDMELIAWYREELSKIIAASNYREELHINTIKLTTWWQDLLYGDPVVINILRYGEALIDSGGFFNPLKALLLQGKIKSTPEAVYAALQRAPSHLARSKGSMLQAIEGVYWTMVDAAQAALITAGKIPPSPEHIPLLLKQTFVDTKMMKIDGARAIRDLYLLHKSILYGEITHVKGEEIDLWQQRAEKFLGEMNALVSKLLETQSK
jgi:predicted nucleotidyltransferase/uncharacterized protein (UPF0332 family)